MKKIFLILSITTQSTVVASAQPTRAQELKAVLIDTKIDDTKQEPRFPAPSICPDLLYEHKIVIGVMMLVAGCAAGAVFMRHNAPGTSTASTNSTAIVNATTWHGTHFQTMPYHRTARHQADYAKAKKNKLYPKIFQSFKRRKK